MKSLFVLGGARSGKSLFAQRRTEEEAGRLAFIATAQPFDDEMAERIANHRADRSARWSTYEAPLELAAAIETAAHEADAILVDCLTLWTSNLLHAERDIPAMTRDLCQAIAHCPVPLALVANEVGLGIVPDNALARRFRDAAGRINQRIAAQAGEVVFLAAGLPLTLKSPPPQP